jgi:large subunit ribosomal protein L22
MEVRAVARYLHVSPQKARLVVDTVRGKPVKEALALLRFLPQKSARLVWKVVKSAAANAENNYALDPDELYIKRIYVDNGPMYKRARARARGMRSPILKRTSHITVIVEEKGAK